uniref:Uncharacterized protein n=1 Tax=Oryza glumipatula TaxID=40148 RepID=A0A0E0BUI7_9ORYZ
MPIASKLVYFQRRRPSPAPPEPEPEPPDPRRRPCRAGAGASAARRRKPEKFSEEDFVSRLTPVKICVGSFGQLNQIICTEMN